MIETIVNAFNSAKRFIGGTVLAGAMLLSAGCPEESEWWNAEDERPTLENTAETMLIPEEYGVDANIIDRKSDEYDMTRFSLSRSPILPIPTYNTHIDRLVATIRDSDGFYRLFWLRDVDFIDRNASTAYLNDGSTFQGEWIANNTPVNFYNFEAYATGMLDEDGVDVPKRISVEDIDFMDIEGGSFTEFETRRSEIFAPYFLPMDVELWDGRTFTTNLGHVIDCCGHGYSNTRHIRLGAYCDVLDSNGNPKSIHMADIESIELTGAFNPAFQQCRRAGINYKSGGSEAVSLRLTSESYGGFCNYDARFREFDSVIIHDDTGATIIPLDEVRKITPRGRTAIDPLQTIRNTQMHEGMNLTSWWESDYVSNDVDGTIDKLHEMGVESLSVLATWYQDDAGSTSIYPMSPKTPTDQGIEYVLQRAESLGMRTVLKPHVDPLDYTWRGLIEFTNESEWADWFSSYSDFIMHYAQMAEVNGVDMLVIGTELEGTVHRPEWSQIISDVRSVYSGEIVYAANHDGYQAVPFWGEVDYIGIDDYFGYTGLLDPTPAELQQAADLIAQDLEAFSIANGGKKIMITEVGYQSYDGANTSPWWAPTSVPDEQEQADCYNAMFNSLWNKPFIAGIYPWMTYFDPSQDVNGFDVIGKEAENVFQDFFHRMD